MRSKGTFPILQARYAYELDVSAADQLVLTVTSSKFDAGVLYVGGAGNLELITSGGQTVTLTAIPAGTFVPVHVSTIKSLGNGTTATALVLLCD